MTTSNALHNAWDISERIQTFADEQPGLARCLDANGLRFTTRNGWFCNDDILKPSVGLMCFKAALTDMLAQLGLVIVNFKHEGNFRFTGTCVTLGGVDSETMSFYGDSDTAISHTVAWLQMADQQIRKHLGAE